MATRLIRDGILDSHRVNALSLEAELFYRRLLNVADDYGRFDARPTLLRSRVFPLHETLSSHQVQGWYEECVKCKLILPYQVGRQVLGAILDFHQQIRTESKFPAPPADLLEAHGMREVFAKKTGCKTGRYSISLREDVPAASAPGATPAQPAELEEPLPLFESDSGCAGDSTGDDGQGSGVPDDAKDSSQGSSSKSPPDSPAISWSPAGSWVGVKVLQEPFAQAFPACTFAVQLARAEQWLLANPTKAHKKNWRKFLMGWFQRAQEKGGDTASRRASTAWGEPPERVRDKAPGPQGKVDIPPKFWVWLKTEHGWDRDALPDNRSERDAWQAFREDWRYSQRQIAA